MFRYDVISNKKNVNPHILALHHHNEKTWISSSSGGVFASLTDYALRQAGVIFGAIYDDNFVVVHRRAETQEDTLKFRGSKYVQSNLTGIYQQVKFYLQEQRFVLFQWYSLPSGRAQRILTEILRQPTHSRYPLSWSTLTPSVS